jgi:hypothetical protein
VTFDAKGRTSKSRAAIERAQESDSKKKSNAKGRYYVAEPRVMDGGEFPTRDEWLREEAAKTGQVKERPRHNNSDGGQVLQGRK